MSISCASMNSSNDSSFEITMTTQMCQMCLLLRRTNQPARYIVRVVRKLVNCPVCVSAEAGETLHPSRDTRIDGLVKASESAVRACHETEKCFEFMMKATSGKLPHCKRPITSGYTVSSRRDINNGQSKRPYMWPTCPRDFEITQR